MYITLSYSDGVSGKTTLLSGWVAYWTEGRSSNVLFRNGDTRITYNPATGTGWSDQLPTLAANIGRYQYGILDQVLAQGDCECRRMSQAEELEFNTEMGRG